MFLFCFTKILNQAFYMTHTFDSEGFFTLLVALARGVAYHFDHLPHLKSLNLQFRQEIKIL